MPSTLRLRDLIRAIRACKTAQDERDLINKECAYIRTSFKVEDSDVRARSVAKLLYIHMMGYPAHFGQMECIKLIASSRFSDKRVGYLGAMMLLDEKQDVHLLITNSMKNDMNHQVQYVVGLALCAMGSICSDGMSRDLCGEVEKLLKSSNPYIVRKAALCAVRIVRKVPDLMEMFVPTMRQLLNEKNHGVLLTGTCLVSEMCRVNPDSRQHFRRFVPNLVRILKNLVMAGYSPEHDVHGISDPFLQVCILRLMRILGHGDQDASEAMNDILAQVATNTDANKNVGHSILYETVLTIMDIKSESGLRVLAVNILGRMLSNSDKNIRYVALNTLLKTVHVDNNAVQRHRTTILDCLKENDISLKRRSLELSFALINENNIRSMMKEIVAFLDVAEPEFKSYITSNILVTAERYHPSKRWYVDTILSMLIKAGSHVRDDLVAVIISMVSENTELHSYSVRRLFVALQGDTSQQPLTQVAVWSIGEFGDSLLTGGALEEEEDAMEACEEGDVITVLESVLYSLQSTLVTKEYALNAVMKLSSRFSTSVERIRALVDKYRVSQEVELQQRAVEYRAIFTKHDGMRAGLLERMPAMSVKASAVESSELQEEVERGPSAEEASKQHSVSLDPPQNSSSLLDLLGDTASASAPSTLPPSQPLHAPTPGGDLLDLLGMSNPSAGPVMDDPLAGGGDPSVGLLDLLGGTAPAGSEAFPASVAPPVAGIPSMTAYESRGLKVEFSFEHSPASPTTVTITAVATNSSASALSDFLLQAAVPKGFQLQMQPPSGNTVPPASSGVVTQVININNPQKQPLRVRLRVGYTVSGSPVVDQAELNSFPEQLWQ